MLSSPFGFEFKNSKDGKTLVSTKDTSLIMMDKYIQIDLTLPSRYVYGLGERHREFLLKEGTWTMWADGRDPNYDDGKGGKQLFGVHPFALVQTSNPGEYMGIFFRNSNAMSPVLRYVGNDQTLLSFISTGG